MVQEKVTKNNSIESLFVKIVLLLLCNFSFINKTFAAPADPIADAVLGQSSFVTSGSAATAGGMLGPASVAVDPRNGRLYVSVYVRMICRLAPVLSAASLVL